MPAPRRRMSTNIFRRKMREAGSGATPTSLSSVIAQPAKPREVTRRQYLQMAAGTAGLLGYSIAARKVVQGAEQVTNPVYRNKITHEERMAAAARANETLAEAGQLTPSNGGSLIAQAIPLAANPGPGDVPDYFSITVPNWAYSPPIRKFVDGLPGLGPGAANNLGQYIPIANPDKLTYPGSDYYEISLREYNEKLHSDLPPTRLRGYVQTNNGTNAGGTLNNVTPAPIHYLGPLIIAQKDRAVRIRFTNELPTGAGGNLFIPVDEAMMGAGLGPMGGTEIYTQNRAVIHLHGADAPWISDGTPHQWITPAGETTSYPDGASVLYSGVPDMPDPGPGQYNYYYPNQMSARLMFYHDHALGITRLNVYVGMAAGYIIQDPVEAELVNSGIIPADQIPLIVQDKTFVDAPMIPSTDPTWNWGITPPVPHTGDLWMGHVYNPAQNPWAPDNSGINPMGRWHYAPWFWPPATNLLVGPQPNPYYDSVNPANTPWEAPFIPGAPHPAMQMESFQDTMLVNGTAFPYVEVDPKSYRLRVLNACNDRFLNLQMYEADSTGFTVNGFGTEIKTVVAAPYPNDPTWPQNFELGNATWPIDGRDGGVPDWNTAGPDWIVIGTEGGFLPMPAVVPQRPIDWNVDVTTFNAGIVNSFSLALGPAERADVIVDFSQYAGKTLIVYNDAPAPFPAPDPRLDYYTGSPDMADAGGYTYPANGNTTLPGHGPNTRTVMQIRVRNVAPAAQYNVSALNEAWASNAAHPGVFERTQPKLIVPNAVHNDAYRVDNGNGTFSPRGGATSFPADTYVRIFQNSHTFKTISGQQMTLPLQPKAIQDEMGEAYDPVYGRMSGMLGLELPNTVAGAANFMLYPYASPPVEVLKDSMVPLSEPMPGDGTQLWKITHNGVDTHPIHFHLFNVQVINRVAWDGFLSLPHPTERGWKETLRVSPLEDTIVALRPVAPQLPFKVPNSIRPIDATMPLGETLIGPPGGFFDPTGNPITITNQMVNFGWEYVIHCHILGHEEMDMMHGVCFAVAPDAPTNVTATVLDNPKRVSLSWTNPAVNATGFKIERATNAGFTANLVTRTVGMVTTFDDTEIENAITYFYRVAALNTVGSTIPGFPTATAESAPTVAGAQSTGVAQTRMVTISPTSVSPAKTITVTASLKQLPGLTDVVRAGMPVLFNYVFHKIESSTTESGTATVNTDAAGKAVLAIVAPNEKATVVVDAIFNGDANLQPSSNMSTIAVVPFIQTVLTASNAAGVVTFHLADSYGNAIAGQDLSFLTTAGTLSVGSATTDISGNAQVVLSGVNSAVISASFGGFVNASGWSYQPSQARITAEIAASGPAITRVVTASADSVSPGQNINMTAQLQTLPAQAPVNIAGLSITFNYVFYKLESSTTQNGSVVATTNASGVATLSVPAPNEKSTVVIDAVFFGDANRLASSHMGIIAVVPFIQTVITGSTSAGVITFHLADQYGNPLVGRTLSFLTTAGTLSSATGLTSAGGDVAVALSGAPGVVSASFGGYQSPAGWSYQPTQCRITVTP
ncbi:laccase [Dehalogenimonas alkenigignens]|uniref:laccase n=1 Tax=Dehalogenimonas alkenigignens TaxID=1217799 RepID=UPI001058131A|nr:laccase [Dehalogenimonas alkenigignens]